MKIIAGALSLLCIGLLASPPVVLAQEPAGPEAPTPEEQTGAALPAPAEDYTAYIRPLDKLRTELAQQQALLDIVVDITTQIDQLRNRETQSDILVLLDGDLSQAERIKAVLSAKDPVQSDELALIRNEIEFLKSMIIQTLHENSPSVINRGSIDAPAPWALGASSIQYVQAADQVTAGFVAVTTGAGNRVFIKANESRKIAGKTIFLDSVKLGPDGRIWIHFVVDGKLKTVYYSP